MKVVLGFNTFCFNPFNILLKTFFSGNIGYEVYKGIMGEELFKKKIEEFEKVIKHCLF